MRDGPGAQAFPHDEPSRRCEESIERLVHIEQKIDGLTGREDARYGEVRERLIHVEERLDFLLERQPHRPARPIAFLHLPKTAGTSFTAALVDAVKPRCPVGGFDHSLFGAFSDFSSFTPERRREVYAGAQEISPFCDMLAGHFGLSTIRAWAPDASVVMLLREPFSRLLSHWTFWRAQAGFDALALGAWNDYLACAHTTFLAFLAAPAVACQTDNVATRMLLWPHELIPGDDFIAPAHDEILLAAAKRRLGELAWVNLIENPDLCDDMAAWLGRKFAMQKLKETAAVPAYLRAALDAELTQDAMDIWARRTRLDRQLWGLTCRRVMRHVDVTALREAALARAQERYRALLAGN